MILTITHETHYVYEPTAAALALRLKNYPSLYDGQKINTWSVTVNGDAVVPLLTDGYGDDSALWHSHEAINGVKVIASGTVTTDDTSGIIKGLETEVPDMVFLRDTKLTRASDDIRALAQKCKETQPLEHMHALCKAISETMSYRPGKTDEKTTADQALAQRSGVCQDFTHVMIAAARAHKMPARYVSGYLLASEDQRAEHETHAWAEIHIDNLGWVGFDPTNGICPTERYVRLSSGFDADSAAPIKGAISGAPEVEMTAHVEISAAQLQGQDQIQQ